MFPLSNSCFEYWGEQTISTAFSFTVNYFGCIGGGLKDFKKRSHFSYSLNTRAWHLGFLIYWNYCKKYADIVLTLEPVDIMLSYQLQYKFPDSQIINSISLQCLCKTTAEVSSLWNLVFVGSCYSLKQISSCFCWTTVPNPKISDGQEHLYNFHPKRT